MYLVFNNDSEKQYALNAFQEQGSLIVLQTKETIPENNSGFIIYEADKITILKDCSDYTTKYNKTDIGDGIIFSNDESVEDEDNNKLDIHFKNESLDEIRESMIDELKTEKIKKSKQLLSQFLEENPLVSSCHNNKECTYSITLEKQSLMMSQYMTYQIEKQVNPDAVLTWNESGEECEVWTEEEFLQLVLEVKHYVYPVVSYQQSLEKSIKNVTTIKELDAIVIDYSQFNDEIKKGDESNE